jgi:hypothetical protein
MVVHDAFGALFTLARYSGRGQGEGFVEPASCFTEKPNWLNPHPSPLPE